MRILVAEDDFTSRTFLQKFLSRFGQCDVAIDGLETINAYLNAHDEGKPYDLLCLDIMMPKLDGLRTLKAIKDIERQKGIEGEKKVKTIMTTALNDSATIQNASDAGSEAFAWKPIETEKLVDVMKEIGVIK